MRHLTSRTIVLLLFIAAQRPATAASALSVLGKDHAFPNRIDGLPSKLSDFKDLQIGYFQTHDGVKLAYWEAGKGKPLVFVPGWSENGAGYINVLYLLREGYHVYVLDPRNQGLSQRVDFGNRIARYATDLKEFIDHLGLQSADFCGHSMGAAILWSYIDLYGTSRMHKVVFVDEPISIASRPEWSEGQRRDFGVIAESPAELVAMMSRFFQPASASANKENVPSLTFSGKSTPPFVNSESFKAAFIKNDPTYMLKVLFDHAANDWHDVISRKIDVPAAIFTGELSNNLPSQRWAHAAIRNSTLFVYSAEEQGDHLLMFRNSMKFTKDLRTFLEK
jgi:pimeloyl-ACP methyl ester carboxylesterase